MSDTNQDAVDVIAVVNRSFALADSKDFDGYRALHADRITVDSGGINDDSQGEISAEAMAKSARTVVGPVATTPHMISNQVASVEGDEATVSFYEQALHHHPALGEDEQVNTWTLYGRGEHRLHRTSDGWKIVAAHLSPIHHTGNTNLLADVAKLNS
ncbi:MAG TPA: nuclear transport factor 2 family protein [Pseudonocardia sp.]|jgi:hypothetical protein|nr:nuclear transport factor 2 family protein [Pseudonocardia sp.]